MDTTQKIKAVSVLTIGNANPNTGKTKYDWGIYDEFWNNKMTVYLCGWHLVFSANEDDFEIGEKLVLRNNDSQRKLNEVVVTDKCICNRDALLEMLLKHKFDYYPKRAFQKSRFKNKLLVSYSVKGITME